MLQYNIINLLTREIVRITLSLHLILSALLLFMPIRAAFAHPHSWIDVQSAILFDKAGIIIGLRETWLFDEFYTEFAIKDFAVLKNGKIDKQKLLELGEKNLQSLRDYSYFTYVDADKNRQKFSGHRGVESDLKDKRISLSFTILLETPIDPQKQQVSYSIYDPSYYIEMKHLDKNGIIIEGNTSCRFSLEKPIPDMVMIAMASSLDKNAVAPNDLGSLFAETITLHCQR